jgi:flagellar biosynthesis chaperone FliJ
MKKTLATLIKLQKSYVDEQRQHLARLQEMLDGIITNIARLEIEKAREQIAAEQNPEARATYGAYAKRMSVKSKELEKERKAAEQSVELARAKLSELFEEQKRYETAEEARLRAEIAEEQRRDRIRMDEVGGIGHERRRQAAKDD